MKTGLILSGGMDSTALAWWSRPEIAFTLDYGQKAAKAEITASSVVCKRLDIEHIILSVDCSSIGSGDLAGKNADKNAPESDWWPFRNQMLITLIAMKAISYNVSKLLIGTVKSDSLHKDGTIEFIQNISNLMCHQEGNIIVDAPAIKMSTQELIVKSKIPLNQLLWAHSCHKSDIPCGKCRGCNKYNSVIDELKLIS